MSARYARVTFRDADGKRVRFHGQWSWNAERGTLRGQRKTGKLNAITLHLAYVTPPEVELVERQDPRYEEWVEVDLAWLHGEVAR